MKASANAHKHTSEKIHTLAECGHLMNQLRFDEAKSNLARRLQSFRDGEVDSGQLISTLEMYADAQRQTGHFVDAYQNYCVLVDKDLQLETPLLGKIFHCLSHIDDIPTHPRFQSHLVLFLDADFTDNDVVEKIVEKVIKRELHIEDDQYELELSDIAQNALLLKALPNVVFLSPKIEIFLNELRFYLLSLLLDEGKISEDHLAYALLEPIGRRSLNNEYVCYQTDIEQELVLGLQQAIDQYIKGLNDLKLITDQMLVLAMYMPLNALHPALADIDLEQWPKALHGLYKLSFANKNEGYPYPRWHSTHIRSLSISYLKAYPHLESLIEQGANFDGQINCLVAGCGTGKHAITLAKNTSDINVTALDFSIHSLTYAKQMAAEYKTGNIEFLHGDILDIPLINKQFNVIECVGVLHHMENPEEGLSTIVESLEHNGILALGLYSKIARREIRLLREANTKIVMQESIENIRDFRFELLSQGKSSLLKSRDFYSTSCCRDMMFLEPETQFTLLAIMVLLEKFHLNFLGFHSLDIKSIQRYRALFPNDVSLTSLENWHQFELQYPETFDQMYQFHCQKRK